MTEELTVITGRMTDGRGRARRLKSLRLVRAVTSPRRLRAEYSAYTSAAVMYWLRAIFYCADSAPVVQRMRPPPLCFFRDRDRDRSDKCSMPMTLPGPV